MKIALTKKTEEVTSMKAFYAQTVFAISNSSSNWSNSSNGNRGGFIT